MTNRINGKTAPTYDRMIYHHRWYFRPITFVFSALLCLAAAEVASRAFWFLRHGVPVQKPSRILYAYYPGLREIDTKQPSHADEFYDILLLGGSVLNSDVCQVEQCLREQLAANGRHNIRIFNLSTPAHTSRDSLLKYAALGNAQFELVVFYHGINEARANNAPPEIFRDDYSHYSWYGLVNALAPSHRSTSFALGYTLHYLAIRIHCSLAKARYVPTSHPREEWVRFGSDARSTVSFLNNVSAILDLAARRGDNIILMTFAIYVPENYSLAAFIQKRLDYTLHTCPIELWGTRENVLKTVAAHNEILRGLAVQHQGVHFVDQAFLMPPSARYFNDPCHFTVAGSAKFVENLLAVLLPSLQSR